MIAQWRIAALGALGGAVIAVAMVFGAASLGYFPRHAAQIDGKALHAWLVAHPQVLAEMSSKLQDQQASDEDAAERARQAAADRKGLKSFFDPAVAYVTGPANARTTFVEFYDYDCPFCRASAPVVKAFFDAHRNDTRFAFVELPIPELHGSGAVTAANASLAARHQGDRFACFHFALMSEQTLVTDDMISSDAAKCGIDIAKLRADMSNKAIGEQRTRARKLAATVRFDGTPTFIINGKVHSGQLDKDTLKAMTGN